MRNLAGGSLLKRDIFARLFVTESIFLGKDENVQLQLSHFRAPKRLEL